MLSLEIIMQIYSKNWILPARFSSNSRVFLQDIVSETISRYSERCASSNASFSVPMLLLHGVANQVATVHVSLTSQPEESDTFRRPGEF